MVPSIPQYRVEYRYRFLLSLSASRSADAWDEWTNWLPHYSHVTNLAKGLNILAHLQKAVRPPNEEIEYRLAIRYPGFAWEPFEHLQLPLW